MQFILVVHLACSNTSTASSSRHPRAYISMESRMACGIRCLLCLCGASGNESQATNESACVKMDQSLETGTIVM